MTDLIARLLLKTQQFDQGLGASTKQVKEFQAKIDGLSKGATMSMMKFAGAAGIGVSATALLKSTIDSTQTTSDLFEKRMDQVKASVDSFFSSIAKGDFTGFISNLQNVIDKAGNLSVTLDDLATKRIFTGIESAELERGIVKNMALARNTSLSEEVRKKAKKEAESLLEQQSLLYKDLADKNTEAKNDLVKSLMAKQGYSGDLKQEDIDILLKETNRGKLESLGEKYKQLLNKEGVAKEEYLRSFDLFNKKLTEGAKRGLDSAKEDINNFLSEKYLISEEKKLESGKVLPEVKVSGEMAKMAASFFQISDPDMEKVRTLVEEVKALDTANDQRLSRLGSLENSLNKSGSKKAPDRKSTRLNSSH